MFLTKNWYRFRVDEVDDWDHGLEKKLNEIREKGGEVFQVMYSKAVFDHEYFYVIWKEPS